MATAQLHTLMRHIKELATGRQRTDPQLLEEFAARGDESAFAALLARHGPLVLRVCRRVLRHEQDAEDAFQATFLVLARSAKSIRRREALASWLYGVAYRTAMEAKRKAAQRRSREARLRERTPPPVPSPTWDDVRAVLDEEILRLPESFRAAFVSCVLEGQTVPAAAAALGVKEGTLSWRLARARQQLRRRLARRGIELTAVLAALSVAEGAGQAAVHATLARATVGLGLSVAAGEPAATAIPSHVAALAAGVTRAMFLTKTKIAIVVLLAAGLLAAGVGVPWHRTSAAQESKDSPPAAPAAKALAKPPAAEAKPPAEEDKDAVAFAGRVLDPDGKPVKGARLYTAHLSKAFPHRDTVVAPAPTKPTDAEGRFHIQLRNSSRDRYAYLLAYAPGFGVDWINLSEDEVTPEVTFRLVKDVPITGRVVSTEGQPIAGVSVSVAAIFVPVNEKLDDYLKGWYRGLSTVLDTLGSPRKRLYAPLDGISGAATTDKDGRFTLHGAGGERIAHVAFSGGGVARTTPCVITRSGFDPAPYNALLQKEGDLKKFVEFNRFRGLYPPAFTFVAEAGKTIEGAVKDAATGQPLAGCQVLTGTSYAHGIAAVSNHEGKYRLDGLAKNPRGYHVWARPPKTSAYLYRMAQAADTVGFTTVRLDIELVKGAIVTGRVVDKRTGKGVPCYVSSTPLPDNKFFASKPGFDLRDGDTSREIEIGADGRFRLVTIPGKALLAARVRGASERFRGQRLCTYRQAVPDPDHKDLFKEAGDTWTVRTAGNRLEFLSSENAVKVIEVQENGETRVELSVDRGAMARIAVQDADGKPLAGAWAAGLTDMWPITHHLPEATATVYALNPDKPRTMAFFHAEKKLGGTATLRGDEKEPVVVQLAPLGKLSGRLLDEDGNPLEGVEVSINARTMIADELYRFAAPTGRPAHTGKDGRFHIEGVVPDLKFTLNLRRERTFFVGEPRLGVKQVSPGEPLDLGSLRVKPAR